MDWIGKKIGIKSLDDWYTAKWTEEFEQQSGLSRILRNYGYSLVNCLTTVYSEHPWQEWKFEIVSNGFWDNETNVAKYLEWAGKEIGIHSPAECLNISSAQLKQLRGSIAIQRYGGIKQFLSKHYPELYLWEKSKVKYRSKGQGFLYNTLQKLFTDVEIHLDYRHSQLKFTESQLPMQLDVYLPDLQLAFEYQGELHYQGHFLTGSPEPIQKRDQEKLQACKMEGITLIQVPYWWDQKVSSLLATIHQVRPDITKKYFLEQELNGLPIPIDSPKGHNRIEMNTNENL